MLANNVIGYIDTYSSHSAYVRHTKFAYCNLPLYQYP